MSFEALLRVAMTVEKCTEGVSNTSLPESCLPSTAKEPGEYIAKFLRLQGYMISYACPADILAVVDEAVIAAADPEHNTDLLTQAVLSSLAVAGLGQPCGDPECKACSKSADEDHPSRRNPNPTV